MLSVSSLYIHVPFCRRKCSYCDFFSVVSPNGKRGFLDSLFREIEVRAAHWALPVHTLYWGGGTPSSLSIEEVGEVMQLVRRRFDLSALRETTFEANPDDLTSGYLEGLRALGFDRLSIGVQSLNDDELRLLNRRHDARRAVEVVGDARRAGFDNLSLDLMYGLPTQTADSWQRSLDRALALGIEHLSAYHLSYEEGTPLFDQLRKGRIREAEEAESVLFYEMLHRSAEGAGLSPYEISNFCRPGRESLHNGSYWDGTPYLGLGPSAHSFDGDRRWWNVRSLEQYVASAARGESCFEQEVLTATDRYNDFIITTLRRVAGFAEEEYIGRFGKERFERFEREIVFFLRQGLMKREQGRIALTHEGLFVSDRVFVELIEVV